MYILHTHLHMYSNSTTNIYSTNYNMYTVHTCAIIQYYMLYMYTVQWYSRCTILCKRTHEYSTKSAAANHTQNMVSFPVVATMGETMACYLSLTEVKCSLCDVFVLLICLQHKGMKITQLLTQFSSVECHHYRYMLCGSLTLQWWYPADLTHTRQHVVHGKAF